MTSYRLPISALAVCLIVSFASTPAYSATSEEVAEELLNQTAGDLGIEPLDEDLFEELQEDLEYAIDEEVIDPELSEDISDAIDSEDSIDLSDDISENLEEQEDSWKTKAPELLTAFEQVKVDFFDCRSANPGPANVCARGLGFRLQVASVEMALADLDAREAELELLEGEELALAEAEIAQLREQLQGQLERAQTKLERLPEDSEQVTALGEAAGKAQAKLANARPGQSQGGRPSAPSSTAPNTQRDVGSQPSPEGAEQIESEPEQPKEEESRGRGNGSGNSNGNGNSNQGKGNQGKGNG